MSIPKKRVYSSQQLRHWENKTLMKQGKFKQACNYV